MQQGLKHSLFIGHLHALCPFVSQEEAAKREEELEDRICALEAVVDSLRQNLEVCACVGPHVRFADLLVLPELICTLARE